jgi:SpoVK/Ycf46/Vps4 family AAA+-type ATPase
VSGVTGQYDSACILESLRRLDRRLWTMVEAARMQTGREPGADPFRGLYISEADVQWHGSECEQFFPVPEVGATLAGGPQFAALGQTFGLSSFALDALLIALAPELDLRYERIFAYLQDDVSRRRPCIDLVLSLLCYSPSDKLERRREFDATGPLRAHRMIRLLGDEWAPTPRRELCPDPRIAAFLVGEESVGARLACFVQLHQPPAGTGQLHAGLAKIARRAMAKGAPLRVYFQGGDNQAKSTAAGALAAELSAPLLVAEAGRGPRSSDSLQESLEDLAREALLRKAVVLLEGVDFLVEELRETVLQAVLTFPGVVILSGAQELQPGRVRLEGLITVFFEIPKWPERRLAWKAALGTRGVRPRKVALDALAECFRFNSTQIEDAAETAVNLAHYRGEKTSAEHAFEAARIRSSHELGRLTRKVVPVHSWADIVLPADARERLREICRRVERRHQVLGKWGFERKLSGGKGVNALFHGHSGTGKTMGAEVVARELHLDLFKIDLAGVVSKYIGETEKNLDRIFAAAADANAILLFDEADALFGKRSEVRDSHDRYANLEISYLLQKMEQHEGVSILATNLRQNLDDAFLRRLSFTLQFPFPDELSRQQIWQGIWPKETPLAADLDAGWLGSRFLLSGGNIRNAALAAAYLAVEEEGVVSLAHVLRAVESEFRKMGKTLTAAELAPPKLALGGAAA